MSPIMPYQERPYFSFSLSTLFLDPHHNKSATPFFVILVQLLQEVPLPTNKPDQHQYKHPKLLETSHHHVKFPKRTSHNHNSLLLLERL